MPKISKKKEKPKFRFAGKKVGLTYSCPKHLKANPIDMDDIRTFLYKFRPSGQYIIGRELHDNEKHPEFANPDFDDIPRYHFHVYFKDHHIIETIDPHFFDITSIDSEDIPFPNYTVHPNIISAPGVGWIQYCVKDGDYDSNFYKKCSFYHAMEQQTYEEAIEYLWKNEPKEMCKSAHNIEENIRKRFSIKHPQKRFFGPFDKQFYPQNWDPETHSLLLVGPPGIGKTQFARYFFGENDYVSDTIEGIRSLQWQRPVVFDDINFCEDKYSPWTSKAITDVENGGTIAMRNKDVQMPPGVKKIFCSNKFHPFRNPEDTVYGRRVVTHDIAAARVARLEEIERENNIAFYKKANFITPDWLHNLPSADY